jgi:hypothetical protein
VEQAVIGDITLVLFVIALVANTVALVRHWRALRAFNIVMSNLAETQCQFNALVKSERQKP